MHAQRRLARLTFALPLALAVAWAVPARAEDPPPSPERLKAAAEEFDRGRRAYLAKDFEQAAVHFENAFRDAPRAETLRLAIRARREAEQPARAATLAAVALERYENDAATSQLARTTLGAVAPELQEYVIECAPECAVAADGRVVSQSDARHMRIFLDPGPHELGVSFRKGGSVARRVEARKGGKETLTFEPPPEAPSPPPVTPPPVTPPPVTPPPPAKASGKPLGPAVFFVAAGVTVAAGAATVVSGIDAQNNPGVDAVRRACAGKDESCPLYQEGKSAELRTNVLLGVTAGAALVTGVVGLFFTDWGGGRTTGARPGPTVGVAPTPGGAAVGLLQVF